MMSEHKKRADQRGEHNNPINFTCGVCKQVHSFDEKNPYECIGANYTEEEA